jgi:hypothetical protein
MTQLLPDIPAEPKDGSFLYNSEWKERQRTALTAQVKHHFTEIGLEKMKEGQKYPYSMCDVLDTCMIHGFKEPKNEPQRWLDAIVVRPELTRRRVNACRDLFPEKLPVIQSPGLGIDLSNFHEDTMHDLPWMPQNEELRSCQEVLEGHASRTMWVKYSGDGVQEGVRFVSTSRFFAQKVLHELIDIYSFESCKMEAIWMRAFQMQQCNCNTATFAVGIRCLATDAIDINAQYKILFEKSCVSGSVQWNFTGPSSEDEFGTGVLVVMVKSETDEMEW